MAKRGGFSLLELVVVLLIIGLLTMLVSVRLNGTLAEARETRIEADLALLITAGEQYLVRTPQGEARDQETLVRAGVLAAVVESPLAAYDYHVRAGEGEVVATLEKEGVVYERGQFRAEKTSSRLYLD
ncbi:MAG: prepilin-type N-terminal cleavage/methylation domain-containing protein [Peptococcaceae bacterium]|nr:prepilin-type N-terminal cleavage/methylation domain-containing protein [Peptococcaceae bacterium]